MKEILYAEQKEYLDLFDQETDTLLLEMEDFADKNSVPILSRDSAKLMELLIQMNSPERVLELGTAIAYTTIRFIRLNSVKIIPGWPKYMLKDQAFQKELN
jgi:predicted O-methyltransferase YrrM